MGYDMGYYEYDHYYNRYDEGKLVTWRDGKVVDCWDGNCMSCRFFEDCSVEDRHGLYMRYEYDPFEDTYQMPAVQECENAEQKHNSECETEA